MDMKKKMMRMTKGREQHPGARAKALRDENIIIWQVVVVKLVLVAEFNLSKMLKTLCRWCCHSSWELELTVPSPNPAFHGTIRSVEQSF